MLRINFMSLEDEFNQLRSALCKCFRGVLNPIFKKLKKESCCFCEISGFWKTSILTIAENTLGRGQNDVGFTFAMIVGFQKICVKTDSKLIFPGCATIR